MVLHEGCIAELDSPNVLLERQESIFYGMAREAGIIQLLSI